MVYIYNGLTERSQYVIFSIVMLAGLAYPFLYDMV